METVPVGSRKQLLFDDFFTAAKSGVTFEMIPACKAGPVLVPEKPWERLGIGQNTVIEDGNGLRMWYFARGGDGRTRMCLAVSPDGLKWRRPSLGRCDFGGSRENNIILERPGRFHGGAVFADPEADPRERYKLICGLGPYDLAGPRGRWDFVNGAFSPDGLAWTFLEKPICPWYTDTMNVAFRDRERKKYVAYLRWDEGAGHPKTPASCGWPLPWGERGRFRAVCRTESDDFTSFPLPEQILEPDAMDRLRFSGEKRPRARGPMSARDAETPVFSQPDIYNTAALQHPSAERSYFIFPSIYYHYGNFALEPQLAASRDGRVFTRWRKALIGPGRAGEFDARQIYCGVGLIERAGESWMYYHGSPRGHSRPGEIYGRGPGERRGPCPEAHPGPDRVFSPKEGYEGGIGRLVVRADGFAACVMKSGGRLLTRLLCAGGGKLEVNMDAGAGGWLKVSLLDENEREIPGYGPADADFLWGNDTGKTVTWGGASLADGAACRPLRLLFTGEKTALYSFRFTGPPGA